MNMYFKALALSVGLAAASTASAQSASPDDCEQLTDRIEFCGESNGWSRLGRAVAEATAVYKRGDNTIGKLIVEMTGTKALRDKDVQSAILKKVSGQIRKLGGKLDVIALKGGMMNRPAGTILLGVTPRTLGAARSSSSKVSSTSACNRTRTGCNHQAPRLQP